MPETMTGWAFDHPGRAPSLPIRSVRRDRPAPAADEILVQVRACGICRTDLHLVEGDLGPRRPRVIPGHQIVGVVVDSGDDASRFALGSRVGIAWLRKTCGACRWCRSGAENLCQASLYTGWDADGGLAEYAVVPEAFAYRIPEAFDDVRAAPLLCAGIIGYRALRRANLPAGGRLGIYGFGSSAHITAQIALAEGAELSVMTRGAGNRALARELGASFVTDATGRPPGSLDSAIVFAPAGELVPLALEALDRGGTLALAGIHMTEIPALDYERHLFEERDLRTVTANTRRDGEELLRIASRVPLRLHVTRYGFEDVDTALLDLASGRLSGSAVVVF